MRVNAFCTKDISLVLEGCDRAVFCGECRASDRVTVFGSSGSNIYIPDMLDEDAFETACDIILSTGARAVVRAAYDLEEAGRIEARYKLSPVMLLHRLGVAEYCTVAGGVCLDNDDLDLMAQEGMSLVLTPTASAGYGHGFAPVCAALARGIRVGVGTFDNVYNRTASLEKEIEFLRLTANAEMRCENAIDGSRIKKILAFEK